MEQNEKEAVVPVITEELHADAIPVETGGVRVIKHLEGHEEILEQELRRGRVEVKRVKMNRVVDGPQTAQRRGNVLVVPVVSEVLRVEKQWVLTEEIHITQIEEQERAQQKVTVNEEHATVERLDEHGNVIESISAAREPRTASAQSATRSILHGENTLLITKPPVEREVLSNTQSVIKNRRARK
jgi:stress response protein YsnF